MVYCIFFYLVLAEDEDKKKFVGFLILATIIIMYEVFKLDNHNFEVAQQQENDYKQHSKVEI